MKREVLPIKLMTFGKGYNMIIADHLPAQTITEAVNIRQVKHIVINDPLIAEEYYTLAPRLPLKASRVVTGLTDQKERIA